MASVHNNIICDECGVGPLVGVRYVATHLYEYDICSACFQEHHASDGESFVAFSRPDANARRVCAVEDDRILADSPSAAAEKIGQNTPSRYAKLSFFSFSPVSTQASGPSQALRKALKTNTNLQILSIHMCGGGGYDNKLTEDIATGISGSTSIKIVDWHIRTRNPIVARILRNLIAESKVLQVLSIAKPCWCKSRILSQDSEFVRVMVEGLQNLNVLKTLRIDGYALGKDARETLLNFVRSNPSIHRLHADFAKQDGRMELLLACNKEKWEESLAKETRARQRLDILLEALNYEATKPVLTAYQLLRSFPEMIINSS